MSHHSPDQVAAAFATAPKILQELRSLGVPSPRFELYADASGTLFLGSDKSITPEQVRRATQLIHSNRPSQCTDCWKEREHDHQIGITFCCGLVVASGAHE